MQVTEIILRNLPKLSLNSIYAGLHWTKRKRLKDAFYLIIKSQFKTVFPKTDRYTVSYEIVSKNGIPCDATNLSYTVKMVEDVIFEDDKWDIITQVCLSSRKGDDDYVKVTVTTLDK